MNIPQQKLCTLIARYGEALCNDPHRCEALLRDLCAPEAYPKEISLIRQAQEQGLVQDLLNVKHCGADYKTVEAKWLRTLKADYAIAEEAARWTIEAWGQALGVSSKASPQPTKSQTGLIVSAIVVLLAVSGIWLSEQYRIEMERQKEVAKQEELQRQEDQRKATIEAAYSRLICPKLFVDQSLTKKKPDYIYPDATRYYGPMQANLPMLEKIPKFAPSLTYSRTMIFSNGLRYDGDFENGKRNGCGVYTYSNGAVYIGQFANDWFNGIGLFTAANQSRYVGEVKDGRCHGEGILILPDGQLHSGTWEKNKLRGIDLQCGLPEPRF